MRFEGWILMLLSKEVGMGSGASEKQFGLFFVYSVDKQPIR